MVTSSKKVVVDKVVGNLVKFYCADSSETPEFHYHEKVGDGVLSLRKDEDIADHKDPAKFEREARAARLQRRGAQEALDGLSLVFGASLFKDVPVLTTLLD